MPKAVRVHGQTDTYFHDKAIYSRKCVVKVLKHFRGLGHDIVRQGSVVTYLQRHGYTVSGRAASSVLDYFSRRGCLEKLSCKSYRIVSIRSINQSVIQDYDSGHRQKSRGGDFGSAPHCSGARSGTRSPHMGGTHK